MPPNSAKHSRYTLLCTVDHKVTFSLHPYLHKQCLHVHIKVLLFIFTGSPNIPDNNNQVQIVSVYHVTVYVYVCMCMPSQFSKPISLLCMKTVKFVYIDYHYILKENLIALLSDSSIAYKHGHDFRKLQLQVWRQDKLV